ncbi:hypothetical protein V2J94_40185 [Streptomyces sp. DSM 41524]|uniref:Uncharacterized protein n=1 Tax=Streptomyces asiaticus subsp. ignotus TaxID=3098222 RepID=A0ABU7Q9G5_9ACTN|nr:hypothetical protein [Streptomyces sp. DSM 41524]
MWRRQNLKDLLSPHSSQQRKEEETRQRWLAAMQQARTALVEDHRVKALHAQVQAWQQATTIRAYCDALKDHQDTTASAAETVTAWIAWAQAHADRIDPVPQNPGLPDLPAITPLVALPTACSWLGETGSLRRSGDPHKGYAWKGKAAC